MTLFIVQPSMCAIKAKTADIKHESQKSAA